MTIATCSVIGAGTAARALVPALHATGIHILTVTGRNPTAVSRIAEPVHAGSGPIDQTAWDADLVVVAVADSTVATIFDSIAPFLAGNEHTIVAHLSGATRPLYLERISHSSKMHPIASLAGGPDRLTGIAWGIEADDYARPLLFDLVERLGGSPIDTSSTDLTLYHLSAVFGSNLALALLYEAARLWEDSGAPLPAAEALIPLARTALDNWASLGLPRSLTGPVARGDSAAVAAQLRTVAERGPKLESLYRNLSLSAVELALKQRPDDPRIADIARLLAESTVLD